jgi:integrase/recombinase XerC
LRSFFKFLVEENVVEQNPAALVKKAKMPRNLAGHVYMTASEARQLLQAPGPEQPFAKRDLAMLAVMLFCGLRVSEVSGLNIESIKREEMALRVHGKGNKIREVPLEALVLKLLDDHLATRPVAKFKDDGSLIAPTSAAGKRKQLEREESERNALFLSKNFTRITPRAIRMIVDKYMGAVQLDDTSKHISPHKLRHTFATLLYLNGTDINVLKELLGHADLSSTQIYAAVDKDRKRKAVAKHPLLT